MIVAGAFLIVGLVLILNGLLRIYFYGDWPMGLQSLGIGLLCWAAIALLARTEK